MSLYNLELLVFVLSEFSQGLIFLVLFFFGNILRVLFFFKYSHICYFSQRTLCTCCLNVLPLHCVEKSYCTLLISANGCVWSSREFTWSGREEALKAFIFESSSRSHGKASVLLSLCHLLHPVWLCQIFRSHVYSLNPLLNPHPLRSESVWIAEMFFWVVS